MSAKSNADWYDNLAWVYGSTGLAATAKKREIGGRWK
jgi:hypothetical protein